MSVMITFAAAGLGGLLFYRLKVPGGMMIGAVCATVLLSLSLQCAFMPYAAKFAAQITAGAFIGCSVEKNDLLQLRAFYRPALVVVGSFLALNLMLGLLLWRFTSIPLLTALLCTVPGGMSDLPLTAADMGADVSVVVVLQFVRLCAGIGLFPSWIAWLDRKNAPPAAAITTNQPKGAANRESRLRSHFSWSACLSVPFSKSKLETSPQKKENAASPPMQVIKILFAASLCGLFGRWLGVPAGVLLASLLGTLALKMTSLPVRLPRWIKRLAQVLSGAYIGCSIGSDSLRDLHALLVPAVVVVLCYMANAYLIGKLLTRRFAIPFREAMLMATPAGASDMALISADIGVQSSVLVVVQIVRMLCAASLFPQICYQIAALF